MDSWIRVLGVKTPGAFINITKQKAGLHMGFCGNHLEQYVRYAGGEGELPSDRAVPVVLTFKDSLKNQVWKTDGRFLLVT